MNLILGFLVVFSLMIIFVFLSKKLRGSDSNSEEKEYLPYVKRNYLMSKAEHNFYDVLKEVVGDKYYIVPQVQLSKIVDVNKYAKKSKPIETRLTVNQWTLYFLIKNFLPHTLLLN